MSATGKTVLLLVLCGLLLLLGGCSGQMDKTVPHAAMYGIYELDLATQDVRLVYSSAAPISALHLNNQGDQFVFAQRVGGDTDKQTEICTVGVDGSGFANITDNSYFDAYPTWSPDGTRVAFISWRGEDFDIFIMDASGANERMLYDSGAHEGDVHWVGNKIVFTSNHYIWTVNDDGTNPQRVTNPAGVGQWGTADVPIGDYDPRFSPDGSRIVFERLEDPNTTHGSYNIFVVGSDGKGETRLTSNGYSQGLAYWSNAGDKLVYTVGAMGDRGVYDLWMMDADGKHNRNITPEYFADSFLCNSPVFSKDDSKVYFIGEWWPE